MTTEGDAARPRPRWRPSAAPASSSAPCATRCCAATSTSPCTRSRTSRRTPTTASRWPRCPTREDPRDAVVARDGLTLGELPAGSRVGTGSPRRVGPAARPRPRFGDRRTSVGTSTPASARSAPGEYDAVVLARAGLARIGRLDEATEVLDPLQMLPAPGQGALAVECRADDADLAAELAAARRPAHPGGGRGRARRARHARGWLLGADRSPGRGRRGRGRGRDLGQGRGPVPRRGALGADVRIGSPGRRRGRRDPAGERDARRRGRHD